MQSTEIELNTFIISKTVKKERKEKNTHKKNAEIIYLSDCGQLSVANAVVDSPDGTLYGVSASISCNEGYNINGPSVLYCTEHGWDNTTTCEIQGKSFVSFNNNLGLHWTFFKEK